MKTRTKALTRGPAASGVPIRRGAQLQIQPPRVLSGRLGDIASRRQIGPRLGQGSFQLYRKCAAADHGQMVD